MTPATFIVRVIVSFFALAAIVSLVALIEAILDWRKGR